MDAALAFRNASATNRYREAMALQKRLPVVPVISATYSGTSNQFTGRGSQFIVRDYGKPSFVLDRSEVLRLLGTPALTNALSLTYAVARSPEHKFNVYLKLGLHNGHVADSDIFSSSGAW